MLQKIEELRGRASRAELPDAAALEAYRLEFLSKKGALNQLFADFKNVAPADKRAVGAALNELKTVLQETYDHARAALDSRADDAPLSDLTRPATPAAWGSRHPISLVRKQITDIFAGLGYVVTDGPEVEDDWHVFSALNFPAEHPARDMQDTFFVRRSPDILLRTHTSSVQVRAMEAMRPPIRVLCPGRVFRNEAISARAHCIFHQIEGLSIDRGVTFADMKHTLLLFAREMFGAQTRIRLRPSYFPFTEPSAEMDVSCSICGGKGCNICKGSGWLEIMGCGMVDPNVLREVGIDPDVYSGFAFGMGIERIAMLKYQVRDLRLYFENDIRFLEQFANQL